MRWRQIQSFESSLTVLVASRSIVRTVGYTTVGRTRLRVSNPVCFRPCVWPTKTSAELTRGNAELIITTDDIFQRWIEVELSAAARIVTCPRQVHQRRIQCLQSLTQRIDTAAKGRSRSTSRTPRRLRSSSATSVNTLGVQGATRRCCQGRRTIPAGTRRPTRRCEKPVADGAPVGAGTGMNVRRGATT